LEIKEWNNIHDKFVEKFGWEMGTSIFLSISKDYTKGRSAYELNQYEQRKMIIALRAEYNKEAKCLEKEKAK
tara:strand:- start:372 stop:587 length:216 start_codon:yes stop_codon:yes gene_type:complete